MPFGEEIADTSIGGRSSVAGYGAADYVTQKFTGKERDPETGLDYFGARYLSSAQGRWMSPDWSATPQAIPYADISDPQTLRSYMGMSETTRCRSAGEGNGHDGELTVLGIPIVYSADNWQDFKAQYAHEVEAFQRLTLLTSQ